MSVPTVFPTGVTIYQPEKCWNSCTLFQARGEGAVLIDMTGREIHKWSGVCGMPKMRQRLQNRIAANCVYPARRSCSALFWLKFPCKLLHQGFNRVYGFAQALAQHFAFAGQCNGAAGTNKQGKAKFRLEVREVLLKADWLI